MFVKIFSLFLFGILIELGFINNEYDRGNLMNRQDAYARVIADGILENLNK